MLFFFTTKNISSGTTCPLCGKQFPKNGPMRRHFEDIHQPGEYPCPGEGCGKVQHILRIQSCNFTWVTNLQFYNANCKCHNVTIFLRSSPRRTRWAATGLGTAIQTRIVEKRSENPMLRFLCGVSQFLNEIHCALCILNHIPTIVSCLKRFISFLLLTLHLFSYTILFVCSIHQGFIIIWIREGAVHVPISRNTV